jgi:hypothetical protein
MTYVGTGRVGLHLTPLPAKLGTRTDPKDVRSFGYYRARYTASHYPHIFLIIPPGTQIEIYEIMP